LVPLLPVQIHNVSRDKEEEEGGWREGWEGRDGMGGEPA